MKKIFFIIIILLITKITFAKKIIKEENKNKIYIGKKIGWSKFTDLEYIDQEFKNYSNFINKNKINTGLFIEYKKKYLNFELGYNSLGTIKKYGKFIIETFNSKIINSSTIIKYKISKKKKINLYIKIGNTLVKSIYKKKNKIKNKKIYISNISLSPILSIGIEKKIYKNTYLGIDYQWIYNLGNKNIFNDEPENISLNLYIKKKINYIKKKHTLKNNFYLKKKYINIKIKFYKKKNINYNTKNIIYKLIKLIKKEKIKLIFIKIKNYTTKKNNNKKNIEKYFFYKKIYKKKYIYKTIENIINIINKKYINIKKIFKFNNLIFIKIKINN